MKASVSCIAEPRSLAHIAPHPLSRWEVTRSCAHLTTPRRLIVTSQATIVLTCSSVPKSFRYLLVLLSQVFDVSNNSFTGPVPSFLYANNVVPWTQPTVYIQVRGLKYFRPESNLTSAVA